MRKRRHKRPILIRVLGVLVLWTVLFLVLSGSALAAGEVTIVVSRTNDPHSLDPADEITVGGGLESQVALYERLVNVDADASFKPGLAELWEVSEDGLTYTFHLRKGVKFHDGTDFNAEAVRFTWQRIMAINTAAAQYWKSVKDIEVVDDHTVKIHLQQVNPSFLGVLAGQRGVYMGPSPTWVKAHEKTPGDWAKDYTVDHECGTGPFMLEAWNHDQELIYARFPDYWGGWAGKHVDRIVHRIIKEHATTRLMLEKGDVDITGDVLPIDIADQLKGKANIVLDTAPTTLINQFTFNMHNGPTKDVRVRRAIAMLFDYNTAVDYGFRGYAARVYGPLPSNLWPQLSANVPHIQTDLEKAKKLLAEAGYPDGFTLKMAAMDMHNWKTLILLLQDNLSQAGIKLDVEFTTWPVLFQKLQQPAGQKPFGMAAYQMWAAIPDPVDILMWWHTNAITVINPGWGTPETDKWIDGARSTVNHEKRVELYTKVVEQIAEDAPGVWIAQPLNVMVYQKWLKGYKYVPYYNGLLNWYDLYVEGKPGS